MIESMALQPEYQRCAQHRILQADVGVITNVRHDHADVMGDSLPEIADTLSNTIPQGGVLFTADEAMEARLRSHAEVLGSRFVLARPAGDEPDFDFAENISLALAVCEDLGVSRETALAGGQAPGRAPGWCGKTPEFSAANGPGGPAPAGNFPEVGGSRDTRRETESAHNLGFPRRSGNPASPDRPDSSHR